MKVNSVHKCNMEPIVCQRCEAVVFCDAAFNTCSLEKRNGPQTWQSNLATTYIYIYIYIYGQ